MNDQALEKKLVSLFHWLHEHPELGFEEVETTAKIREALTEAGIEILDSSLQTGLIAQVVGGHPGKVVCLRCDIDALPIQEESGLAYASKTPGRMHACGHDSHTAIILGAALLLKQRQDELRGTVKFIFQPAEEAIGGAQEVVKTGLLEDVALYLGVHCYPWLPAGKLGLMAGAVTASVDRFAITIHGRGAHAAEPHKSIDPITVQAALVQSLNTIVSRGVDPFSNALLSITHAQSGTTWNVIPETALLEGTIRTMDAQNRAFMEKELRRMAGQIAEAYGAQAEVNWIPGPAAVVNHGPLCAVAEKVALERGFLVEPHESSMGGEDFSCFLERAPGLFIRVGTGGSYPFHHPKFTVDPAALAPAAGYIAELAAVLQGL